MLAADAMPLDVEHQGEAMDDFDLMRPQRRFDLGRPGIRIRLGPGIEKQQSVDGDRGRDPVLALAFIRHVIGARPEPGRDLGAPRRVRAPFLPARTAGRPPTVPPAVPPAPPTRPPTPPGKRV